MNYVNGFGGLSGFWLGLIKSGFEFTNHYYSDIDKNAIAVASYKDKNLIDIGRIEDIKRISADIFTFGSPCQGFSFAGRGEGIKHKESGLIEHAIRFIKESRPSVFIWENVKGTITRKHRRDFWAVVKALANIGGYRLEWELLDSSWVLPQQRQRIYLVGRIAERCTGQIFPIQRADIESIQEETRRNVREWMEAREDAFSRQLKSSSSHINRNECEQMYASGSGFRQLTITEKERIQGYPDDWTKWGSFNGNVKVVSESARSKMLGNAVSVQCVQMVGKKILENTILN